MIDTFKDLARRLNAILGSPVAPIEEHARRRAARKRLHELRAARGASRRDAARVGGTAEAAASGGAAKGGTPQGHRETARREPAPVMVYFEKDRNVREVERARGVLDARGIAYKLLDLAGDEAALAFVTRAAKCKEDDLPIIFIAGTPVGGARDLVALDASGELKKQVDGP